MNEIRIVAISTVDHLQITAGEEERGFGLIGIIDNVSNTTNCSIEGSTFSIGAPCSTLNDGAPNPVTNSTHYTVENSYPIFNNFNGVVECSSQEGGIQHSLLLLL